MTRAKRTDSVLEKTKAFASFAVIPVPHGVKLTEEELCVWDSFTRARAREYWRDLDLILLVKAVRLEVAIRKHQSLLDNSGPLIKNQRGTLVENPMLRVVDTLQRQQLSIIRSMSLNTIDADSRTANGKSADLNTASKFKQIEDDLIMRMKH